MLPNFSFQTLHLIISYAKISLIRVIELKLKFKKIIAKRNTCINIQSHRKINRQERREIEEEQKEEKIE